jgi:hypothetical protein
METIKTKINRSIYESKKEQLKERIQTNACIAGRVGKRYTRIRQGFDTLDNESQCNEGDNQTEKALSVDELNLLNDLSVPELIMLSNHFDNLCLL